MAIERLFRRRRTRGEGREVPELWIRCEACGAQLYKKDLEQKTSGSAPTAATTTASRWRTGCGSSPTRAPSR